MVRTRLLVALVALFGAVPTARAEQPIEPGMALGTEDARYYEKLLQAPSPTDNTVEESRHFSDRPFQLGVGLGGVGGPLGLLGMYGEVSVWDRLALGAGFGVDFWGFATGGYARLRPIAWGGEGKRLLNALTVQAGYSYMAYGELDLLPCIDACSPEMSYSNAYSHFGTITLGMEHLLWGGFTFRYDVGWAHLLMPPKWSCELEHRAIPCGSGPAPDFIIQSFSIGHTL